MANLVEPRTCKVCGKSLPLQQGRGRARQYCSARCRDRARRQRAASPRRAIRDVKDNLTAPNRHGYLDLRGGVLAAHDPVTTKVAEAAQQLFDQFNNSASPDRAVAAARELSAAADAALQAAVDRARSAGHTWRDIGHVLGTSRQAAFQRFGHPVDPRTGQSVGRTVPSRTVRQASEFLASFTAGRWEEVLEAFDEQMRQSHDADRLASGWAHMIGLYGRYEGLADVSPVAVGDSAVVDVLLRFEAGEAMAWVRFNGDGRVTGLRLHPLSLTER
jgi:hypothetical protein